MRQDDSVKQNRYAFRVVKAVDSTEKMRRTPEALLAIRESGRLASFITKEADKAQTVEQLVYQEMVLQDLDRISANTDDERSGIDVAAREYRQLAETVAQMRGSPDQYILANISIRETGGDYTVLPRSRGISQIRANITRLRNRSLFAPEEQRMIWQARIALAGRTESLFRALHKEVADQYKSSLPTDV